MATEDLNLPEQCCTLPPFVSNYEPVGRRFSIDVPEQEQLPLYETGNATAQTVLVGVHGRISSRGCRIIGMLLSVTQAER